MKDRMQIMLGRMLTKCGGYWQISGRRSILRGLLACYALSLAGCGIATVDNRGYVETTKAEERIKVGESSREDVKGALGSPSTTSDFPPETWYYISRERETIAFLPPETLKQNVLQIEFDEGGKVSKMNRYGLDKAQDIEMVQRATPTEGRKVGFVEQLLGNVGKFNTPKDSTEQRQ